MHGRIGAKRFAAFFRRSCSAIASPSRAMSATGRPARIESGSGRHSPLIRSPRRGRRAATHTAWTSGTRTNSPLARAFRESTHRSEAAAEPPADARTLRDRRCLRPCETFGSSLPLLSSPFYPCFAPGLGQGGSPLRGETLRLSRCPSEACPTCPNFVPGLSIREQKTNTPCPTCPSDYSSLSQRSCPTLSRDTVPTSAFRLMTVDPSGRLNSTNLPLSSRPRLIALLTESQSSANSALMASRVIGLRANVANTRCPICRSGANSGYSNTLDLLI